MKEYLLVTNDDVEQIIFSTPYIEKLAQYTGKTTNNIKSSISKHKNRYSKWRGAYKIEVSEEV